ncbi:methyltransferase domain-containing protein [Azospirillum sp. TSH58]|uniref:methyltransferase domain-containing protein n=1 Tax=Azospirillum sp. TSH58 TaxID=664962 RepID=UPI001FFF5AF8|nr:methyltransferase domain-containing protein [Azospirillum sp. TSH58]
MPQQTGSFPIPTRPADGELRLVQVESFYPRYIEAFYEAHPALRAAPFDNQIEALVLDGFSALHNIAPYLSTVGYEAHLIIGNAWPAQRAWLRENGFPAPSPDRMLHEVVRRQVDALAPDILYCSDAATFDSAFIRSLRRRPRLVVGWHAAKIPVGTDWSEFDLILSGLAGVRDAAKRLGVRAAEPYMPGFPEWIASTVADVPETCDLVFPGSYTRAYHAPRNLLVNRIAEAAEERGFSCALHLGGDLDDLPPSARRRLQPQVFGLAMQRVLKSGRIVFDARGDYSSLTGDGRVMNLAGNETSNMRLFEATGGGAFLLTEHHDNLASFFQPGRDIETFTDVNDLIEKIEHYLANPEARRAIARNGQRRCLEEHGMAQRIHEFDAILRRHLSSRSPARKPAVPEPLAAQSAQTAAAPPSAPVLEHRGYSVIDRAQAQTLSARPDEAWSRPEVCNAQEQAFRDLLAGMRAGAARSDLTVAAQAVEAAGLWSPTLLEVGCGSGYYAEVFDHLLPGRVRYAGIDRSTPMIALACQHRPGRSFAVANATRLPYGNGSMDIVFNGVSLMHTMDYEAAIAEARRVARRFVVFHTVPVLARRPTTWLRKSGYGAPMAEVILNEGELRALLVRHGLLIRRIWRSIPYDLADVLDEPTPTKTYLCEVVEPVNPARPLLLNIGCGERFHDDWVNMDVMPYSYAVLAHDAAAGLPFLDGTFDAVYHSHVLEHLSPAAVPAFLRECRRVLKPGGTLRIAVPDLEAACRAYLGTLAACDAGEEGAAARHDWMIAELVDQLARHTSGGRIAHFLERCPVQALDFIRHRIGSDAEALLSDGTVEQEAEPAGAEDPTEIGRFRLSGEVHRWMYDRLSLRRCLEQAGFVGCRPMAASESAIPGFALYHLETTPSGTAHKPDSLFMEAVRE